MGRLGWAAALLASLGSLALNFQLWRAEGLTASLGPPQEICLRGRLYVLYQKEGGGKLGLVLAREPGGGTALAVCGRTPPKDMEEAARRLEASLDAIMRIEDGPMPGGERR